MRQRRAPASGPRDCCARLAQAGVRNPCDQTAPFRHRQQRGGAPRFTRLRQAPPASSDNERGHRRRAGGDLRSPRSAAPSDPARNIPAGRAYANPRFCTPALPAPVSARSTVRGGGSRTIAFVLPPASDRAIGLATFRASHSGLRPGSYLPEFRRVRRHDTRLGRAGSEGVRFELVRTQWTCAGEEASAAAGGWCSGRSRTALVCG